MISRKLWAISLVVHSGYLCSLRHQIPDDDRDSVKETSRVKKIFIRTR